MRQINSIEVNAPAERVWHAIVDETESAQWYFGTGVQSDWLQGGGYRYLAPDGSVAIEGTILSIRPGQSLSMSFQARWDDSVSEDPPSQVTWRIEPVPGAAPRSRVTVEHRDVPSGSATEQQVLSGWPTLLAQLKAHVESRQVNN